MSNEISKPELKRLHQLHQKYDDLKKEMEEIKEKLSTTNLPIDDPKVKQLGEEVIELRKRMDEILIRIDELKEVKPKEPEKPPEPPKEPEPSKKDKSIFM